MLFLELALESAPALLVAYVLAGLVGVFVTAASTRWLGKGAASSQALKGVVFGLPLPICSCGVLPIYEALVRRGVPATAAIGFLIATPELGIDAILVSLPLLGSELTGVRVATAFGVALAAAWIVGRTIPAPTELPADSSSRDTRPLGVRVREGLNFGLVELFDHTMPWVLVGLLVAAWASPLFAHEALQSMPSWAQVPLFAIVGIPLYVCASGATPIAAVAIFQGVSPGAALAFLLAGPATNVTTFAILSQLHGKRAAALFGAAVTGLAIISGWLVDALDPVTLAHDHQAQAHFHSHWYQWVCLAILGLLVLSSLFRQGPRGFVHQVIEPIHVH